MTDAQKGPVRSDSGWRNGWYVVPYEIGWRDLDGLGHVNNAVYFTFFENGRTRYWFDLEQKLPSPGLRATDLAFIAARAECDFRLQLSLSERIEIRVRISAIRNSSFDFESEIAREDGSIAASGKVVVVLFDWNANRKMAVGEALRKRIEEFQS